MDDKLTKMGKDEDVLHGSIIHYKDIPSSDFPSNANDLKSYCYELEQQNEQLSSTLKSMEDSETYYAQLYNKAPAGYVTINQNHIVLQANQTFSEMVNLEGSQIVNSSLIDLFEGIDRPSFLHSITDFLASPEGKCLELKLMRNKEKSLFVRITGNLMVNDLHKNRETLILLIICDITKQKNAEDLLTEREYSFRSLADSGQALIWSSGPDKLCNYFNNVWLNFTGRPLEMELGNGWTEGIHPEDFDRCVQAYLSSFDKREPFNLEYRLRHVSGEYKWMLDKGVPNYNAKGEFIGYIGHCFDISEIKLTESRITIKNEELIRLNAEKDKFFSIIAHDLRSPFNSFLGLTQLMAEELPRLKISEIQYFATSLNRSASNLFGLLENLLEWSSLQRGVIGFKPVKFALKPRLTEILHLVIESANGKGIKIEINMPDEIQVFADMKMFESTIRNLVSNAIKFSFKGGTVTITARSLVDGTLEFSVQDTGIGMSQEILDELFQLHFDTNRVGTDGEPSSGLGLILCKDFIEKHSGQIWAESEERKGSRFCFTIPNYMGLQSYS